MVRLDELTHINKDGYGKMVDVSNKAETLRVAIAKSTIYMNENTIKLLKENKLKKGDPLSIAIIAGIQAVKKTSELIPLCHTIIITGSDIKFEMFDNKIDIFVTVKCTGQTGVEMEALTGATISALTIYDMCKAVDKNMTIGDIILLKKTGGKSGGLNEKN